MQGNTWKVVDGFELVEHGPWTLEQGIESINKELAKRGIDAERVVTITPFQDGRRLRILVFYRQGIVE